MIKTGEFCFQHAPALAQAPVSQPVVAAAVRQPPQVPARPAHLFPQHAEAAAVPAYHFLQPVQRAAPAPVVPVPARAPVVVRPRRQRRKTTTETVEPQKPVPEQVRTRKLAADVPLECAICLDEDFEKFKEFSCGHHFHVACLEQLRSYSCPMCRKDIKKELPAALRLKIAKNRGDDSFARHQLHMENRQLIQEYQRHYNRTGDYAPLQTLMMNL